MNRCLSHWPRDDNGVWPLQKQRRWWKMTSGSPFRFLINGGHRNACGQRFSAAASPQRRPQFRGRANLGRVAGSCPPVISSTPPLLPLLSAHAHFSLAASSPLSSQQDLLPARSLQGLSGGSAPTLNATATGGLGIFCHSFHTDPHSQTRIPRSQHSSIHKPRASLAQILRFGLSCPPAIQPGITTAPHPPRYANGPPM